jgi:hypothetical protein
MDDGVPAGRVPAQVGNELQEELDSRDLPVISSGRGHTRRPARQKIHVCHGQGRLQPVIAHAFERAWKIFLLVRVVRRCDSQR